MSNAPAALTPRARLRRAKLVVEEGWPVARPAERYDVSWPTARRWADRYRRPHIGRRRVRHRQPPQHHDVQSDLTEEYLVTTVPAASVAPPGRGRAPLRTRCRRAAAVGGTGSLYDPAGAALPSPPALPFDHRPAICRRARLTRGCPRGVRAVAGHHGTHGSSDDDRQAVPYPAAGAGIRQTRQRRRQPGSGFGHGDSRCVGQGRDQR